MPRLGLGVYKIPSGVVTEQAVVWALAAGYRLIDTASFYGNEVDVGLALKKSGLSRSEVWITTKLWPSNFLRPEKAFYRSLEKLGLDYLDLYLIHWPFPGSTRVWKILEKIYKKGDVKAIGVSNYSLKDLKKLLPATSVTPAVNQVEFSPFLYRRELLEYCREKGMVLEAYSPLTRGKKLENPIVEIVAKKYNKSVAQIMIRWALQHGLVVIPKSSNQSRIVENGAVFDFTMEEEDMLRLDSLDENFHALFR